MKKNIFLFLLILFLPFNSVNSQWIFAGSVSGVGPAPVVSTPNCSTLVIGGGTTGQPKILASTNNGPLIDITGNISGAELTCIWAKNRDTIFAGDGGSPGGGGGNAKVWRTINGGVNWSVILTTGGTTGFINGIVFERPALRFGVVFSDPPAGSGPAWYAKTWNGGETWTIFSGQFGIQVLNSVFCVDSLLFGFAPNASPPRIYYTSNGGTNWNTPTVTGVSGIVTSIAFSNDKLNGIAGTSAMTTTIGRTTNGGVSWFAQSIGSGLAGYCNMKWIWESNTCFLSGTTGSGGCIKRSTDAGLSWSTMTTAGLSGIAHFDANRESSTSPFGTAIISDGSLIKLACQPVGLSSNNDIPENYFLYQNYPNPFNPVTEINFSIPKQTFIKIMVYDILGNEIKLLINEIKNAGNYSVEFDGSDQPSGVYYYRLLASNFTDTKKMMLIK
ncbi:MAG TPA: T9SS type A sorting domain-containing protein [Ignavibacteria bacterium]